MPPSRSYSEAADASTSASSRSSCGPFRPAVDEVPASRRDNTKSRQDDERRRARELSAPRDYRPLRGKEQASDRQRPARSNWTTDENQGWPATLLTEFAAISGHGSVGDVSAEGVRSAPVARVRPAPVLIDAVLPGFCARGP